MKVLLTGASGFIGQNLLEKLNVLQYDICILSRKPIKGFEVIKCDFINDDIPAGSLESIDIVFHLAGFAHDFNKNAASNLKYKKINTEATVKLARLAVKNHVKQFIYVSSVKAGGSPPPNICLTEKYQGEPDGIYGESKREAEIKILEIGKQTKLHVSIIRPTLVYGQGVKGNLRLMLNGVSKGWFPPLPYTSNSRAMVHVSDLVDAIILVSEKKEANGEIFIVSDGREYSTREIYNEIVESMGKKIPKWSVPKFVFFIIAKFGDFVGSNIGFPFDTNRYQKLLGDDCYCSDKIRKKLGFKSQLTFKDALPSMIKALNNSI